MIYFKYKGEPIGKGRPRVSRRGNFVHTYTPEKTRTFEEAIRFEFLSGNCEKKPVFPKDVPIKVEMTFAFSVPKSYSKKKRAACLNGTIQHTHKPDADNVAKSVLDAIQGEGGAFVDDSQVTMLILEKIYAEEPYVEVRIYPRDWGEQ